MRQVLESYPDAITFFVRPPSLEELERRLRLRRTESEETIARRLEVARQEWRQKHLYMHDMVNDDLDEAVGQLCRLLRSNVA
jgi:guanylate kinase